ncbi:MAG: hypothetical protein QOI92_190, partial [Chloroflexota bacterium]|nr:hypothetical protein [Chloroflexota bacterium]
MTEATAAAAAPARPARAPRRSPSELTFHLDQATVAAHAAGDPDWLTADREASFGRYQSLPVEANQLYTTYVDLRTADLSDVRPWEAPATAPEASAASSPGLPDGAA